MEQELGLLHLFQRRLKRGDQLMRNLANEAHRVDKSTTRSPAASAAERRIQRGEQLVPHRHPGVRQGVH